MQHYKKDITHEFTLHQKKIPASAAPRPPMKHPAREKLPIQGSFFSIQSDPVLNGHTPMTRKKQSLVGV
jgi:hypothetical protein